LWTQRGLSMQALRRRLAEGHGRDLIQQYLAESVGELAAVETS
jgi:hypothetical protein